MSVSRELYLTLCRCHAVVMRGGNNPELLRDLEDWLDDNLDNIEEEKPQPEHISSILERCVSEIKTTQEKNRTDQIIVPLHTVVLYPSEIQKLLTTDMDLYMKAVKRGKSEKRYQANEHRESRYNQARSSL